MKKVKLITVTHTERQAKTLVDVIDIITNNMSGYFDRERAVDRDKIEARLLSCRSHLINALNAPNEKGSL